MKNAFYVILLLNFSICLYTKAQVAREDSKCYTRLMQYIDNASAIEKPKGDAVYLFQSKILNIKGDKKADIPAVINIKTLVGEVRMINQTNVTTVYLDTAETFVVFPDRKLIIRGNTPRTNNLLTENLQFNTIQKAVLDSCTFNGCYPVKEQGAEYTVYDFTASARLNSVKGITLINYYLNDKTERIDKMIVSYRPEDAVKRQIYIYEKTDLQYRKEKIYPIRTYLFDEGGKLLSAYQDFQYIDNYERSEK